MKKDVFKNFAKLTGKHLCRSLFFEKVETPTQVFFCKLYKIFKNTFFKERVTQKRTYVEGG